MDFDLTRREMEVRTYVVLSRLHKKEKRVPYSGNLSREKNFENWWKMGFCGENFRGLLAHAAYCPPSFVTFAEKTFADRHKTAKFAKDFSLESFTLYGICSNCTIPAYKHSLCSTKYTCVCLVLHSDLLLSKTAIQKYSK